jgi:hypothetical protein
MRRGASGIRRHMSCARKQTCAAGLEGYVRQLIQVQILQGEALEVHQRDALCCCLFAALHSAVQGRTRGTGRSTARRGVSDYFD